MPKNRNELECMVRQTPYAYASGTFVAGGPTYEAWAEVGAAFTAAKWIVCKHTYDGSNNLVRTQWGAPTAGGLVGDFINVIGTNNVTADFVTGISYS